MLVTGSRDWDDYQSIHTALDRLKAAGYERVMHGGARGADELAGEAALALGMSTLVVQADWQTYGRSAGILRNANMLDMYGPSMVLAFWDDHSPGTRDCVMKAVERGIPYEVYGWRDGKVVRTNASHEHAR